MNQKLLSHLREKFGKQMGLGTGTGAGIGTLNRKEATRLAKKFSVSMQEMDQAAKRFGVLIDDPFAERITSYTLGKNSPHGQCVSTITGEVLCDANVGEDEQPLAAVPKRRETPLHVQEDEEAIGTGYY